MFVSIHVNISERTSLHAHFASQASAFIHDDRVGFWIAAERTVGTYLHADRFFTLDAGERRYKSFFRIEVDPDVGAFPFEISHLIKGTGQLTVLTSHTALEVNGEYLHTDSP
jgi:hypothetical protein